jgi:hypothetical protein
MNIGDPSIPPPKRIKRDTKSCLECRRRKVKCQLSTTDVLRCTECSKRGFPCTTFSTSNDQPNPDVDQLVLGGEDRLGRIENLLLNLTNGQDHLTAELRELGFGTFPLYERIESSQKQMTRDFLVRLLPSQHDADLISCHTNAWALGIADKPGVFQGIDELPIKIDVALLHQSNFRTIGQSLLLLALYVQQLPPDFDASQLEMRNLASLVDAYIKSANSWLLSDDESLLTPETLESLSLLGMIYINAGALQKAWMVFRRALDVARMIGLHNSYSLSNRDDGSDAMVKKRQLWRSAVMGECYVGTLLGIESGAGSNPFGPSGEDWYDAKADINEYAERLLCFVASGLIRRNVLEFSDHDPPTQALDAALDNILSVVPESWWDIPIPTGKRSAECGRALERLLSHMWFFLLRLLTHLPQAFTDQVNCTGGSKIQCVEASRAILRRYLVLRRVGNTQLHCRVADFIVFLATVTMLLTSMQRDDGILNPTALEESDQNLVVDVISSISLLASGSTRETVAKQSVAFLKALQDIAQSTPGAPNRLLLKIPYFGILAVGTPRSENPGVMGVPQAESTETDKPDTISPEVGKQLSRSIHFTFSTCSSPPAIHNGHDVGLLPDSDTVHFDSIWDLDFMNWDG